ncbi:hypothetical protein AnigIFM63604_002188 [Aspergillus niger]|uniref:Fumarylacetoacetase n=2 Tax=Aspergillus TaxID=5052 RepID=A0A370PPC3_ASPPH|nr:hypothetical protein CBS147346_7435 [Aspergillus niger]RDK43774.1 hypothetical protein M752DRAFT_313684 [Aspergillus phoenicis ATCC 13157]GLA22281.1 hypothetical protein AnigIFM63326_003187 [Aspergillus niger]GLA55538.1 hypothetical protein AnigIFM63604_002188 [Aspergillus niger]
MTSPSYSDHFSIHNLPYGIASSPSHPTPQCATRLNNTVIFLSDLQSAGLFSSITSLPDNIFSNTTLNPFSSLPRTTQTQVRHVLQSILQTSTSSLPESSTADITTVTMHLPVSIPSFTDYSASLPHNQHAGQIILNHPAPPPAFFHFPIGYAGRASTISVSGAPVTRPSGHFYDRTDPSFPQTKKVIFGPCRALDYELELGIVIGKPLPRGQGLKAQDAEEHIFGLVVLNDWSARDIQGLEMIPLGPLNGKNFATTISPWIITLDALQPFKTPGPEPRVALPAHLQDPGKFNYDISVVTELEAGTGGSSTVLGRGNAKDLFWSIRQMCAHLASTGCDLRTGDILGTGTVSGEEEGSYGCLLEVTEGGKKRVKLGEEERGYLVDGDVVRLTAWAGEGVGFGECVGQIVPARD